MKPIWSLVLLLISSVSLAQHSVQVGEPLEPLHIDDKGEISVVDDELRFRPWSSDSLKGQWTLMQYLAARPSADKTNRWALNAITGQAEQGGLREFSLYNIVNVDDVTFGATSFALNALKTNKKKYPDSPMIADMGHGREHWGLTKKSSAIFLLDADSRVLFFRDGALSQADVDQIIALLAAPAE